MALQTTWRVATPTCLEAVLEGPYYSPGLGPGQVSLVSVPVGLPDDLVA